MRSSRFLGVLLGGLILLSGCASRGWVKEIEGNVKQHASRIDTQTKQIDMQGKRIDGLGQKVDDLDCVMTKPTCPNLLRAHYQPACMQYDQGTVAGCVQYFSEKFLCPDLDSGQCVLVGYPETAPSGCP